MDVLLIALEEFEEDADDLGFDFHDVEVHRAFQAALIDVELLIHVLLIVALVVCRALLVEELILPISKSFRKVIMRSNVTKKFHAFADHFTV